MSPQFAGREEPGISKPIKLGIKYSKLSVCQLQTLAYNPTNLKEQSTCCSLSAETKQKKFDHTHSQELENMQMLHLLKSCLKSRLP